MRLLLLASLLLAPLVLADVGLRNGNTYVGPVRDIDCLRDAGLSCSRDAGESIGRLRCNGASASEPGCVVPGDQDMPTGKKTWNGRQRIVGVVHASLTACSSGEKGTWQTCTTHNAPVFCDGTTNRELLGSAGGEYQLATIKADGLPVTFMGAATISSTSGWTISAVATLWGVGTGSGSMPITIIGTAGTCTCSVDCDVPLARTSCSGVCAFSAADTLYIFRGTSTCTKDPYANGTLALMGTSP